MTTMVVARPAVYPPKALHNPSRGFDTGMTRRLMNTSAGLVPTQSARAAVQAKLRHSSRNLQISEAKFVCHPIKTDLWK